MKTQKTDTVETVVEKIQSSAKRMPEVRVCPEMKIGQFARQGDIYIERVKSISGKGKEIKNFQLAPGTSKGSRHIVKKDSGVRLYLSSPDVGIRNRFQVGPAIESLKDFCITHPEHAWMKLKAGVYQIWYQLDFSRKEKVKD